MTDTAAALNATTHGCSITCKDVEVSIRWYRDAVGFAVGMTFERDGKIAGAVIQAGDIRIVLNQDDGKLGWDRIKGQGCYLQINGPWGARMFRFRDPDGLKLGVSTPLVG